jgi:hypothetical protein
MKTGRRYYALDSAFNEYTPCPGQKSILVKICQTKMQRFDQLMIAMEVRILILICVTVTTHGTNFQSGLQDNLRPECLPGRVNSLLAYCFQGISATCYSRYSVRSVSYHLMKQGKGELSFDPRFATSNPHSLIQRAVSSPRSAFKGADFGGAGQPEQQQKKKQNFQLENSRIKSATRKMARVESLSTSIELMVEDLTLEVLSKSIHSVTSSYLSYHSFALHRSSKLQVWP